MNSEDVGYERCGFMGSPLRDKSKAFALQIIKVCNEVKEKKRESVLTNQLLRSGTRPISGRHSMPMEKRISLQSCKLR